MCFTLSVSSFSSVVYNGVRFRMTEKGWCKFKSALVNLFSNNSYNYDKVKMEKVKLVIFMTEICLIILLLLIYSLSKK